MNLPERIQEMKKQNNANDNKKYNLTEKYNNSLILNLNEENPIKLNENFNEEDQQSEINEELFNFNPELKTLKEEYDCLKKEYNELKNFLEKNISADKSHIKEKEKLKKKIKKRLKQIKYVFKQKI